MEKPSQPPDESVRQKTLEQCGALELMDEQVLEDITQLAAQVCSAPISFVGFLDAGQQLIRARVGVTASVLPRELSFCTQTILATELLQVPDLTLDPRFAAHPWVTGEQGIRFYAGAPLVSANKQVLGTLCVMDTVPRSLSPPQTQALCALSRQVVAHLEHHQHARELAESESRLFKVFRSCPIAVTVHRWSDRAYVDVNPAFSELFGWDRADVLGHNNTELGIVEPEVAMHLRAQLIASGTLRNVEFTIRTREGEPRDVVMGTELIELRGEKFAVSTFFDVTHRKRAEREIREAAQVAQATIEALSGQICVLNQAGVIIGTNKAWRHVAELNPSLPGPRSGDGDFLKMCEECSGPEAGSAKRFAVGLRSVLSGDAPEFMLEFGCDLPTGRRWFLGRVARFLGDGPVRAVVIHEDISERKCAEEHLRKINQTYAMLGGISKSLMRERAPLPMLQNVCEMAVEKGGFELAWVGLLESDTHQVSIAGSAGATDGYLELIELNLRDSDRSSAPTGRTLLSGLRTVCDDIGADTACLPWRQAALQLGYRSSVALPLKIEGRTVGALNLYASAPYHFGSEELLLLDQLATDIGLALEINSKDVARQAAERRLRESEHRFRSFMANNPAAGWIVDGDGRFSYVSPAYYKLFKCSDGDLVGRHLKEDSQPLFAEEQIAIGLRVLADQCVVETIEKGYRPDSTLGQFLVVRFPA